MFRGYRTFAIAALAVLAAAGTALANIDLTTLLGPHAAQWVAAAMAVLMAVLRAVTTTPPGQSEPPK